MNCSQLKTTAILYFEFVLTIIDMIQTLSVFSFVFTIEYIVNFLPLNDFQLPYPVDVYMIDRQLPKYPDLDLKRFSYKGIKIHC